MRLNVGTDPQKVTPGQNVSDIMKQGIAITLGRIVLCAGVLATLSVLIVFIHPAMQGPYSAVHGPVTAFQANRAAARLQTAIARMLPGSSCTRAVCPVGVLLA
jgi:hypothetical protein